MEYEVKAGPLMHGPTVFETGGTVDLTEVEAQVLISVGVLLDPNEVVEGEVIEEDPVVPPVAEVPAEAPVVEAPASVAAPWVQA
ncbi:MAG: hypothetical protein K2Q20_02660 [Phycisphaerales bacterium]|nr:hypothetical protein [Phycisphaerales bacterium]